MQKIIGIITHLISTTRNLLGIQIPESKPPVKLNLGCGLAVHEGWINIDGSMNALVASLPSLCHRFAYKLTGASAYYSLEEYTDLLSSHTFFFADLSRGIPAGDNSVDFLYSSHFLEHLHPADGQRLLRESYRVLKKGGLIRICVPDLEYAIELYQKGLKRETLDQYFFVNKSGNHYSSHKYMYDFQLLSDSMEQAGFKYVERLQYRVGNVPDTYHLDNRPEETLFVEARK